MSRAELPEGITALSGKLGNVVFIECRNGTFTRRYVRPTNPNTPEQQATRGDMRAVLAGFAALTPTQKAAWNRYAGTTFWHNRTSGEEYHPTGQSVYLRLNLKLAQVQGGGPFPVLPPAGAFGGDGLLVVAAGTTSAIRWQGAGGNLPNVTTELLAQPLKYAHSRPNREKYRTVAFHTFVSGQAPFATFRLPGFYAVAIRFVQTQTGQATELVPLGVVQVS